MELVRVKGYMLRKYGRYGSRGDEYSNKLFKPTISQIINDSKAYVDRVKNSYRKSKK